LSRSEPDGEPQPRIGVADAVLLSGLAALAALAILPGLGAQALANWDEATYGALVREFLKKPSLTLVYNGEPYFEKPPLGVWFMAASAWCLGLDEFSMRLPVAIAGIVSVLLTYICGRRAALLDGRAPGVASATGALAALLLLGVPHFVAWSRLAMLDIPLVCCGLVAVTIVLHADERPWVKIAAGVVVGLAVMTKWIAGLLFVPGLLALVAARRGWRAVYSREVGAAALASLVVFVPWHVQQALEHGREFIDTYVIWNTIKRVGTSLELHVGGPLWYTKMYYYNAGHELAIVHAAGVALAAALAIRRRDGTLGALAILALGAFGLINCMATKIGWYLAPVYPGAALATAVGIAAAVPRPRVLAAACLAALALAASGIRDGRDGFVESYNVLDGSPEIRSFRGAPPFEKRVPHLLVHAVSEPAPHFYLADKVENADDHHFEWLPRRPEPFLCLTYEKYADELLKEYPDSGLVVLLRRDHFAVIARR
jgi:4-amino-4-deoxy-L-arabinose transferase-like glycosyltransferase